MQYSGDFVATVVLYSAQIGICQLMKKLDMPRLQARNRSEPPDHLAKYYGQWHVAAVPVSGPSSLPDVKIDD